jgi:gamma-glutamylcyclotransferase
MVIELAHCLAYGSNLHPVRMKARVRSAKVIGIVPMPGKRLDFHKRSKDGSGKCNFVDTGNLGDILYTVLYEFDYAEKGELDRAEGLNNGYTDPLIDVTLNGQTFRAFIYTAEPGYVQATLAPYHWYKEMVVLGAKYHRMPDDYIARIVTVVSHPDPDSARAAREERKLAKMRHANFKKGC